MPIEKTSVAVLFRILQGVRNVRGLALQLGFSDGDRDTIDECHNKGENRIQCFIQRWRKLAATFSWDHLWNALRAPQLQNYKIAEEIRLSYPSFIKQSSIDSACFSMTSTSSLLSPGPQSPGDPYRDLDCNLLNVVNYIAMRSFDYQFFVSHFCLSEDLLESIRKQYLEDEHTVRVVEMWFNHYPQPTWDDFEKEFWSKNDYKSSVSLTTTPMEDSVFEEGMYIY